MKRAGLTIMWVQSAFSNSRKAFGYTQAHVPMTKPKSVSIRFPLYYI